MHRLAATGAPKAQQSEKFVQSLMRATMRRVEKVRSRSTASIPFMQACATNLKLQTSIGRLTSKAKGRLTNSVALQDKRESNRALSPDQVLARSSSTKEAFDAPSNPTHSTSQQHQHLASHQMSGATKDQRHRVSQQSSMSRHTNMQNPVLIHDISNRASASDPTTRTDIFPWPALDGSAIPTAMGPGPSWTQGHSGDAGGVEVAAGVESQNIDERGYGTLHEVGGTALESDETFYPLSESSDDSIQLLFDNSFDMWSMLWDGVER